MPFSVALSKTFLVDCKTANSEQARKELFTHYLTRTFDQDEACQRFIAELSKGAETTIVAIDRAGKRKSGRTDSQTDTIIVEWKKDLNKDLGGAQDQLTQYLRTNWLSGRTYQYRLVATDGIGWVEYAPNWETLSDNLFFDSSSKIKEVRRFRLTEKNLDDFPFFLDQILFGDQIRPATLDNIEQDFGESSRTFINAISSLRETTGDLETQSELKVAFDQWQRFLRVAYGSFDDSVNMFLVHSYLSVFSKLLAYSVITKSSDISMNDVPSILNGDAFETRNVRRFVEDDFFHWVDREEYGVALRPMFREILLKLREYTFEDVREDVLKGVYQNLVDLDTRHALGEYYTPDWLCDAVVDHVKVNARMKVLDPACGSGSFIRATIDKMRKDKKSITAAEIAANVVGIDIHPLSVQIAKTTMLVAMGELVVQSPKPIVLQVFLANSLLVPDGTADMFGRNFTVSVDGRRHELNLASIPNLQDFDGIISFADDMVHRYPDGLARSKFQDLITSVRGIKPDLASQVFDIYESMKQASDEGRDSIWKFILQNSYKPVFLRNQFDLIVGNPPWLTYGDVGSEQYQTLLKALSDQYSVTPAKKNMPHLEIASIFLAHGANYFLKDNGRIAFVLPRSFLSADQHQNTREGTIDNLDIYEIWDLDSVSPLFRVPSCVLYGRATDKGILRKRGLAKPIRGKTFKGRLPQSQVSSEVAKKHVTSQPADWHYSALGTSKKFKSAFTTEDMSALSGSNAYAKRFKQGATVLPRSLFFIELDMEISPENASNRTVRVKSSEEMKRGAKKPWTNIDQRGFVEGQFLFRTALSRSVLPYTLVDPALIFAPVERTLDEKGKVTHQVMSSEKLLQEGHEESAKWMASNETIWNTRRTAKAAKNNMSLVDRLDYQKLLQNQDFSDDSWLVLYTSSSKDACSVVLQPGQFDLPFIVEHKTYWASFSTEQEAHYVCALLNSFYANSSISDFQSRGLMGPRDIHTTILGIPYPRFSPKNDVHVQISTLAKNVAEAIKQRSDLLEDANTGSNKLGRVRSKIRNVFAEPLEELDSLVRSVSIGKSKKHLAAAKKKADSRKAKRKAKYPDDLFASL